MADAVQSFAPQNRDRLAACAPHLRAEIDALPNVRIYVALGRIAFDAVWRLLAQEGVKPKKRPFFEHAGVYKLPDGRAVVAAYHPSRQNTHTGRLTPPMLRAAFRKAVVLAASGHRR